MSEDKRPVPAEPHEKSQIKSDKSAIDAFVRQARAVAPRTDGEHGRLILALDATMSRQPTWDLGMQSARPDV
jgi:hypothetical protein